MKYIVEVHDDQVPALMQALNGVHSVKAKPLEEELYQTDEEILANIEQGAHELNLVLQGKAEATDIQELINSL